MSLGLYSTRELGRQVCIDLRMVRLLGKIRQTEIIFPYASKYTSLPVTDLEQKVLFLNNAFNQILDNILDLDKMKAASLETLKQFGHLTNYLQNSDVEILIQMIYYEQKAAEAVFKKQTIFRWAFDVEVLAMAQLFGLKVKEAPIVWANDSISQVKAQHLFSIIRDLFWP